MQQQRAVVVGLVACGVLGAWLVLDMLIGPGYLSRWACGQVRPFPPTAASEGGATRPEGKLEQVRLPRDRNAERKLEEAKRLIKEQEWRQAIDLLQGMLDEKEDKFMQDAQGRWASVRSEVNRLLASMGREGLQHYEQYYGAQAKTLLQQALETGDLHKLAEVAMRYQYTEAGLEALVALGTVQLDQGSATMAALYFERLHKRLGGWEQVSTLTLVKALFAFERTGQTALRDKVLAELRRRDWSGDLPEPIARLGPEHLQQLAALGGLGRSQRARFDWPMFGGDLSRTAISEGAAPLLERAYDLPTYRDPRVREVIDEAVRLLDRRGVVLPGGLPVSCGDMVLFRTTFGLHAIRAATGEVLWRAAEPEISLETLLTSGLRSGGPAPVAMYKQQGQRAFVYNTLLGTISLDHERAYLVEDTPLPAIVPRRGHPGFVPNPFPGNFGSDANGNILAAIDLNGGRLVWLIDGGKSDPKSPLSETFFLGPPLPLGGKLYALAESNGEIRLVCLEPQTGQVQWTQSLCLVERRMTDEPERRMEACHLAYGDGILVCPTNAGIVLGVDLLSRSLIWAQPYELASFTTDSLDGRRFARGYGTFSLAEPRWYYSAPMIAQGRVVFTAPDTRNLYCLNLQDGTNVWGPMPQEAGDLYVAGIFHGAVVIVGRERVRAVSLADGKPLWSVKVPPPAGRGVANATTYFLPTKTGEVVALSLQDGVILGTIQSSKREPLGNLLFHNGYVLVQGPTSLVAYPQLAVRQAEIARALEKNPNDPFALTERGIMRLHWGNIEEAVNDLRLALKQEMPYELRRRAHQKLFDALTIQLVRDFAQYENCLAEYEQLTVIPVPPGETDEAREARLAEQRQRRATYLNLLAHGREAQGRFHEAFQAYVELGRLGGDSHVILPGPMTVRVIPAVYAESRILTLLARALPPAQRQEILGWLEQEWKRVQASANLEELRRFVALFGEVGELGAQARLLLAEQLLAGGAAIDAEQVLLQLAYHQDARQAVRGVEALAQLHARLGNMENAIFYYRQLAEVYPDVPIRDGKTGRQIWDELATDKRFLPFLDAGKRTWLPTSSEIKYRIETGSYPQRLEFQLDMSAVQGPLGKRYALSIVTNQFPQQLRMVDLTRDGDDQQAVRTLPLGRRPISVNHTVLLQSPSATRCQGIGSYVYFVWGTELYAVDLNNKSFLWKQPVSLLGDALDNWPPGAQPTVFWDQNVGDWVVNYPDATRERVNSQFIATMKYVACIVKDRGLVVMDPRTGNVLWERMLPVGIVELFGDEKMIGVVVRGAPNAVRNSTPQAMVFAPHSGVSLEVPNFLPAWDRKVQVIGRHLLLCEPSPDNREDWRLYDVLTGRNVWSRRLHNVFGQPQSLVPGTFARLLLAPRDGDDERAGELVPHLAIIDVHTGKTQAWLELPDAARLQADSYVLADDYHWYLFFDKAKRRAGAGAGMVALGNGKLIFPQGTLLRSLYVEGPMSAWDRATGRHRWTCEAPPQLMIVERFEESPIILCASWQRTPLDNLNRRFMDVNLVHAIDKRNGKIIECETAMRQQFHELIMSRSRGTVELRASSVRVVFQVADPQDGNGGSRSANEPRPSSDRPEQGPAAQPVQPNPPFRVIAPQIAPLPAQPVPIQLPAQPVPLPAIPMAPKIQVKPLPAVPVQPLPKEQPVPPPPNIAPPAARVPEKVVPVPAQLEKQMREREQELREVRERLRQKIRELQNQGPGIDREKFEEIRKVLEELRQLQKQRVPQKIEVEKERTRPERE